MNRFYKLFQLFIPLLIMIGLVAAAGLPPLTSQAKAHPMLIQIAQNHPDQRVAIIVQKLTTDNRLETKVVQLGGEVTKKLQIINAFAAQLAADKAIELALDPGVRWISLDAPVVELNDNDESPAVTLRADFNQPDFADSSSNWNQPWQEIGESDGAAGGDVEISSFLSGSSYGVRLQGASKGIQSSVDLTQSGMGLLSFTYRRKDFTNEADYVAVEISMDDGNQWTELDRIVGPATDSDLVLAQYELASYLPGYLQLRIVTSPDFNSSSRFYLDYVQVDFPASPKPEPNLPYTVSLPLVVNYNPLAADEAGKDSLQGVEFNYSKTVRDEFSTGTFDGNYGTVAWKGSWLEFDVAGAGAFNGMVSLANGELRLTDHPDTGTQPSIAREVDLSTAIASVFSFDFHTTWGVDADDAIVVEVSKDGGQSYTILRTYTGTSGEFWGSSHFDLSSYMSASTRVRFRVLNNYGGDNEYFIVDNVQVAYAPRLGETVRDEFSPVSYENNAGSRLWSNPWTEFDPDGGAGASGGYIRINFSAKLSFHYLWSEYIQRKANLSGSTQAILSFDWQTVGLDPGEKLSVWVSKDGVTPFVEIGAFVGNQTGAFSYDISPYISANTTIKFGNTAEYWEYGEYAYIDNVQIAFESPCPNCITTSHLESIFAKSIGADLLWNESNYLQGQGITVAVVDSGIAPHQDFMGSNGQSRILQRVEFVSQGSSADDFYGHGTHVAGSIGGNGAHSDGRYPGVAPKVNLIDVKVMDDLGIGSTSDVVAGLQWIYENKDLYNIRIVNLSLNSTVTESYHTSPLDAALEVLWFNGIVVVVSAGNNGSYASGVVFPPANDPFVITVGAVDDKSTRDTSDDVLASFSAFGTTVDGYSKPDIVVPGRNIISPLASDDCNLIIDHPDHAVDGVDGVYYFRMSGTSMASGVAAGAAALLLQDEPNLTPDQVKYRFLSTAHAFNGGNGAGYMDVYQAVHSNSTESANTNIQASQLLWTGSDPVVWGNVAWNSVAWNSVAWNSVAWNSVAWNSVAWNSMYWGP